jgi:L-cysteine/cystine lyase
MDVARLREQIPVCRRYTYVNTGWSGPSPVSVTRAITDRLDHEMEEGPTTPGVYESGRDIQDRARAGVAQLLNASPEEILLTENTTQGLNVVINGLPWQSGDEIITCNLEHNSVLVPAYYQQRRHGAVVKVLDLDTDEPADSILGKVDAALSERTRLVFFSHIQYSSGLRMPVKEIGRLARSRGALMMLDGAQTAGQIALDVADMGVDFYSVPGQKWLLGSEGAGALYMRRDLIPQVEPIHVAGRAAVSGQDPHRFEASTGSIDKFSLTSSSAALRAGMVESIRFIQDIGVGEIEERNRGLATALKGALREVPRVKVLTPMDGAASSGLVSFTLDGLDPKDAVTQMWDRHRIVARSVDYPGCIRVSLHFFNTEDEVARVVEAVSGLS